MAIKIIGEDRLERLSAMLACMGGNPCAVSSAWSMIDGLPSRRWGDDTRADYLVREIADLHEQIREARYWLAGGMQDCNGIPYSGSNRAAIAAFLRGEEYAPGTFQCGFGAGNYSGDLVARAGVLYHVAQHEYRERLVPVAEVA